MLTPGVIPFGMRATACERGVLFTGGDCVCDRVMPLPAEAIRARAQVDCGDHRKRGELES